MDLGAPGLFGPALNSLSHVSGIQLMVATKRASHQNGLRGRSSETSIGSSIPDESEELGQKVPKKDAIARNHAPHSTTGAPTDSALTGRADLLSGCAAAIWNHDPAEAEALVSKQENDMRNIPKARNSAIAASARQAMRDVSEKSS